MPVQCKTVLYPVKDLESAKALFSVLFGAEPHADSPYYVGFEVDGDEIGLVPGGHDQGMSGPVPFYDVEDLTATLAALQGAGAEVTQEPTPVGGGLVVAKVVDADGNEIGLRQLPEGA
jgi:predicted enzyme related to lactoylglutathione lyase